MSPPTSSSDRQQPSPLSRRHLLVGAAAGAAAGVVGVGLGWRYDLFEAGWMNLKAWREFRAEAGRMRERHRQQTAEHVTALKKKYEHAVYGRMHIWDLVEKLNQCIDPSDTALYTASQFIHVRQVLNAMEEEGTEDDTLFLTAMVHDLGKVLLLEGEVPENVVCGAGRLGEYEEAIGLDNVVYQFGHGEFIYSRIKDHVPDAVAWVARYHNIDAADAAPFMNAQDREYTEKYLLTFRRFDVRSQSVYSNPQVDMSRYRDLLEQYFPQPILF